MVAQKRPQVAPSEMSHKQYGLGHNAARSKVAGLLKPFIIVADENPMWNKKNGTSKGN